MMRAMRYILTIVALLSLTEVVAQRMPERSLVRRGNRHYDKERYERSVELYGDALKCDSTSFEAKYDLASALCRTERYDSAEKTLAPLLNDTLRSDLDRADVAYNLGNMQFAQQKYREALQSYRLAMRLNPEDQEAKYNYAYTKRMIQEQENQQNQQNQDQNQDQNKDNQDKQDNSQNNQQGQNDQNKEQPQGQDGKEKEQPSQPREGSMSPEQQEAMLQAIQAEEDKTQDKLKEKAGVIIRGSKSW